MKSVWLFVTFLLVVTSADLIRPKRDVARIQNIIKWLLGINEGKPIQTVPLIENEQDRIYTLPAYQKLLVKTIPRMDMNKNIRYVLTEGLYPGKVLRPVQPIQNINPIVYNSYPPAMRDYVNDRAFGYYRYDRPMYPDVNQLPTYRETVPSLCPTSVAKLACSYATRGLVTEAKPPLPQPPMYIQNRMREVILNRHIPTVRVQEDIVIPPPGLRRVDVSEYSVIDDRTVKNEQTPSKNSVKPVNEQQIKLISKNKEVLETMPSLLQPESDAESQLKTNENYTKNKVSFTGPVQTKYKYKMIYHNQPDRNTVVEMDSMQAQTTNEETTLKLVNETTDQVKNPTPVMKSEDKVPADYIYIPPVNAETLPPGAPRVNANMTTNSDNYYTAVASENRPVMSMDDSPFTNVESKNKPTRVVIRRRKLKSRPESSRGDIPDHAS